jgi:putative membrane protein
MDEPGDEPDPRFTLANERTFLAWNRTALALVAGGLAAGQLVDFESDLARLAVAIPAIVLGVALAGTSLARWRAVQRALRLGEPLPPTRQHHALTAGVVLVGLVSGLVVLAETLA